MQTGIISCSLLVITLLEAGVIKSLGDVGSVLVSVGTEPNCPLGETLDIPFHSIGDCVGPAGIMEAVKAAAEVGRKL